MKLHILKIKPCYFYYVRKELKKAELRQLRQDDGQYEVGDLIHYVDTNGCEIDGFSDNLFEITYILRNVAEYGLSGLEANYAILSIKKVK